MFYKREKSVQEDCARYNIFYDNQMYFNYVSCCVYTCFIYVDDTSSCALVFVSVFCVGGFEANSFNTRE